MEKKGILTVDSSKGKESNFKDNENNKILYSLELGTFISTVNMLFHHQRIFILSFVFNIRVQFLLLDKAKWTVLLFYRTKSFTGLDDLSSSHYFMTYR